MWRTHFLKKGEFIMREIGIERVIEPKGAIPVMAWKLDNSNRIRDNEVRIRLKFIDFERENLDQIYSLSDFDVDACKARMVKMVSERGKFHNPYTESSGLCMGVVEEAGKDFDLEAHGIEIGDEVIVNTPLAGLPMHIEEVGKIDANLSQAEVKGSVICFESANFIKTSDSRIGDIRYVMRALEEKGNFKDIGEELLARGARRVAIIGSNLAETILYSHMVKDIWRGNAYVAFIIDRAYTEGNLMGEIEEIMRGTVDRFYELDISKPYDESLSILKKESGVHFDCAINLENIKGSESIAAFITKERGEVVHISMSNRYAETVIIADSMGKELYSYAFDGFRHKACDYTLELVNKAAADLKKLDGFYKRHSRNAEIPVIEPKLSKKNKRAAMTIENFVFESEVTENMVEEVINIARFDCNVIIEGETGVGKERVFDLIHQNSPRRDKPAIKINCATIPESLAESEFFGYEKGSFTGASNKGKEGYFSMANNGTLFLDEIGSLSLEMQAKLLRVLQENTYYKIGGTEPKHSNVRVVCANNTPLKKLVEEGKFREDLFYRMNICLITVPPLRERKDDIPIMADTFLKKYIGKYGKNKKISKKAFERLCAYSWPGNVRELENTVHRLYIVEHGDIIESDTVDNLISCNGDNTGQSDVLKESNSGYEMSFEELISAYEKKVIECALDKAGTTRKAAELLKMPQATFARKKLKHNL